jgi:hypothetical protein
VAYAEVRATFLTSSGGGGGGAQVRLQLDQEAVISRDAFKATLQVINNSDLQIRETSVELQVVDATGRSATNLFGVLPPTLVDLTAVDGTGLIEPVWTTDRTFLGLGRRPVKENILHLLDYNSPGVHTLDYALPPAPDTNAPTSSVTALPANSYPNFAVNWDGPPKPFARMVVDRFQPFHPGEPFGTPDQCPGARPQRVLPG